MSLFPKTSLAPDPALLVDDTRAEALEAAIDLHNAVIARGYGPPTNDQVVETAEKFYAFLTGTNN